MHEAVGKRRIENHLEPVGGDELAAGQVTIKDLALGRELAAGVTDNAEWREGRPGQVTVARGDLVATVLRIVEAAR